MLHGYRKTAAISLLTGMNGSIHDLYHLYTNCIISLPYKWGVVDLK